MQEQRVSGHGMTSHQSAPENHVAIYQAMKEVSGRMVVAAHAEDWERLTELENRVASMRDQLMKRSDLRLLTAEQRSQRISLIKAILEDDREVRRCTEPWMEKLRGFLYSSGQHSRVRQAYGGGARPDSA